MAFLKPFTVRHWNFLVILLITGLFSGCTSVGAQQVFQYELGQLSCPDRITNVQVIHINLDQIYGQEAVRVHFMHGRWVVYLAEDAGPEVLKWELNQICRGTIWDKFQNWDLTASWGADPDQHPPEPYQGNISIRL
jgi:hypothetical protein